MKNKIKLLIVQISDKLNEKQKHERISKIFENSIFLESDEEILLEWLTNVNEKIK